MAQIEKHYSAYNELGDTPLMSAVRGNAIDAAGELVLITDVNQVGVLNQTALMIAAQLNKYDIGHVLLDEAGKFSS